MSSNDITSNRNTIPVLLLKTRSTPHDNYEEYFTHFCLPSRASSNDTLAFAPTCIPVLEHTQNEDTLRTLGHLLSSGRMKERYGGMIFTSQRAVEAWSDTVQNSTKEGTETLDSNSGDPQNLNTAFDARSNENFTTDILTSTSFPLYVVGPATERALSTLATSQSPASLLSRLNPSIYGAQAGSGSNLAPFILSHYNALHAETWFTFHDAPRLPFIPLLGMGSENYSRRRLDSGDRRLKKRPLCFLVGEQRRDVIPKTLMDPGLGDRVVEVEEVEVYKTVVRTAFESDFRRVVEEFDRQDGFVVVIVFSPQGSGDMLKVLGLVSEDGQVTELAKGRWNATDTAAAPRPKYVVVTIGPTTRDHLRDTFGFEPDVCAEKPSPDGVGLGLREFLQEKCLL